MEKSLYLQPRHSLSWLPHSTVAQDYSSRRANIKRLLPWQPNSAITAYHGLIGSSFYFRAHTIAPAGTAIFIHEAPEIHCTYAGHSVPGFYFDPALWHYRSHNVYVTAIRTLLQVTKIVAWFPATTITPLPSDPHEMLIAAIKDFLHAIKNNNRTGELFSPTLVQDLQDLASLHNLRRLRFPPSLLLDLCNNKCRP